MKRINPYLIYTFGRAMAPLEKVTAGQPVADWAYALWQARSILLEWAHPDSPLLGSARRAVATIIAAVDRVIARDVQAFSVPQERFFEWGEAHGITNALKDLESVLGHEMPDIAFYTVSQKGIFRTDDLIEHADHHLTKGVRERLPEQARKDLNEAGRCLAFELPVACTFHLWRALESVMRDYFLELAGKSFDEAKVSKNWGAYIKALQEAEAPKPITSFLDNIRLSYRNPQTHPDVTINNEDAHRLFAVACGAIDQIEQLRGVLTVRRMFPDTDGPLAVPAASGEGAVPVY